MFIEPNTTIKILKECPLDTTYEHTIFMSSKSSQAEYFSSLAKYTLNEQSYQRVNKGSMNVGIKAENLYDCNYLMFQNTSFGDKWFYAFITSVEYVNNITSRVTFELDIIQTWFFDYELKECFVEREHTMNDSIGNNLVPENLEIGEYVANNFTVPMNGEYPLLAETSIVVASTFDENYKDVTGGYYGGVYSGLHFQAFPNTLNGASECEKFISGAGSKSDGIVSVFCMPTNFLTDVTEPQKSYDFSVDKSYTFDGFVPNNNKLYTYPYNFLYVTNLQGESAVFRYEFFSTNKCSFVSTCDMSCNPTVIIAPRYYKGITVNFDEKMALTGYPQLPFTTDTFKAWLSQNASNLALEALTGASAMGNQYANTSTMLGRQQGLSAQMGVQSASNTGLTRVMSIMNQVYTASIMPNQAHSGSGSQTMLSSGLLNFAIMNKHITKEFAQMVDNFFDVYGYATHRIKVPNRSGRPHWNYVKTANCVCIGSMPSDDMRKLCNIYNNGITFWNHGNEVGNYSLNNKIGG